MYVSMGGWSTPQAPIGALNRVAAVNATWATPTPTRKLAAPHSPAATPTTRPLNAAAIASA